MARAAPKAASLPLLPSQRVERFFVRRLRHGKGQFSGQPFQLEPWQLEDFIVPVYDTLVPRGKLLLRQYNEGLLGVAKKNGKTHLGAGLGLYSLTADGHYVKSSDGWIWTPEYGAEVYNIAGSRDQAKVLFQIGSGFVLRDPYLRAMCRVYRDAIEVPETESVWRVLASDARLQHGPNPSVVIVDEVWVHRDAEQYEAFASAGAARLQPLVMAITTAGFQQESVARALYDRGKRASRGRRPTFYFKWFQAPANAKLEDLRAAKKANPSKWVTIAYLRKELNRAKEMGLENQFRRWHRNEWTSQKEQAIPFEVWERGQGRPLIPKVIPKGGRVTMAVDAAPKRDSTGIMVAYRDPDGIHHWRGTKMRADPETGYLDFDLLEQVIRELRRTYEPERIAVDPYFMVRSMLTLREEGLPIEEFPQGDVRMVPASMNVYELLSTGRLRHGDTADLRAELEAAAKQVTERGWRFSKRKSTGEIDLLTAGTMASYLLEAEQPDQPVPLQFFFEP